MSKILLVDDEKSIRITFSKFLGNEGYEVITAENVEKAFKLLDKEKPDLIITDIIMPQYTGMDLLKGIKDKFPEIPVIVMTGEPSIDTATFSLRYNAYDYLQKPVNKNNLMHTVSKALDYRKILEEKKALEKENEDYRVNLENLVEKRTKALEEAVRATIATISSMLEIRDPYTANHDTKVGNLAGAIAKKMKLSKIQIEGLVISGYLHDIGKISVPSEILSKPGKLSEMEYEIVKSHVKHSYDILSAVNLPWPIEEIIYSHHERLDGSGYPRGLKAEELSIEARILMVADVTEAMLSHRPYRPALKYNVLMEELGKKDGTVYDQEIVAILKELFEIDKYELDNRNMEINFVIEA